MDELKNVREEIDEIDRDMAELFERRMELCGRVARYKGERDLPIYDREREDEILEGRMSNIKDMYLREYYEKFLKSTMEISCAYQSAILNKEMSKDDIIPVRTGGYDIVLRKGALWQAGELLDLERKVLIVTDDKIPKEYVDAVSSRCKEPVVFCMPCGEASKNAGQLGLLLEGMLGSGFTRSDCVLALGGGVVGDLAGLSASLYMRGIDFYNIPTTLLSQVDSSVGGKTAIDFKGVKNIIGAFWQPKRVIVDPDLLKTLEKRQFNAGMAEVIKIAMTSDGGLFEMLEGDSSVTDIIYRALINKIKIVERDVREADLRRVLNFGHTIGHAIEALEGGKLLHGECVAMGMLPMCSKKARGRLEALLQKYSLPEKINYSREQLLPYIEHDKKNVDGRIITVFVDEIGEYRLRKMLPGEIVETCLR